jgi:hypothetical protein
MRHSYQVNALALLVALSPLATGGCGENTAHPVELKSVLLAEAPAHQGVVFPAEGKRALRAKSGGLAPKLRRAYLAERMKEAGPGHAFKEESGKLGAWNAQGAFRLEATGESLALVLSKPAGRGVGEAPESWRASFRLFGVGRPGALAAARQVSPLATENRLEYRRGGVIEWYLNGPLGVEQGFDVLERPQGHGPLTLEVLLTGDLRPKVLCDGRIELVDENGATRLLYSDIFAEDAAGKSLSARMSLSVDGSAIRLEVEDAFAVYPVRIDPLVWAQKEKLVVSDGAAGDYFGYSIAMDGDTAVVGAPGEDIGSNADQGAAYVFVRGASGWQIQAKLTASDGGADDGFGTSVAVSGDTAVVGAPYDDIGTSGNQGSVYVFVRNGTAWSEQQKRTASDGLAEDRFGISVALEGETVVVGANGDDHGSNTDEGSAYVYIRRDNAWVFQAKLNASDGAIGDEFGTSVALSGDTVLVGANYDDVLDRDQGSAYVFVRSDTIWAQQAKLVPSDAESLDYFGRSVAVSGDTAVVGAYNKDIGSNGNQGSAYVFVRSGLVWTEQARLTASDGAAFDHFGYSVAVSGDTVVVGAIFDDIGSIGNQGSAYVFVRSGLVWTEQARLTASDGAGYDWFGISVTVSGDTALVGAPNGDVGSNSDQGAAYVFRYLRENGDACGTGIECHSGFCVDGVCCNSTCGGGVNDDCLACSIAAGGTINGTCGFIPSGRVCRAAVDLCDAVETCTGSSATCPADQLRPNTYACRDAAGVCDQPEFCSGISAACPADALRPASYVCRDVAGPCDVAENCTGSSATCPGDEFQPPTLECRQASCAGGVETQAANCTGASAACPASATSSCAPYVCGETACLSTCATSADCVGGFECNAGVCQTDGEPGDPCLNATDCKSGFCVDQRCCDNACAGQCEACDVEGHLGTCTAVSGAPHGDRASCASDGSACAGACDGTNRTACAYPGNSVQCRQASCANAVAVLPAYCRGDGSCPAEQTVDCAPEECEGDRCARAACTVDTDCNTGEFCAAGVCVEKLANGEVCAGTNQCVSGFCADGYCCDTACDGQCEACDATGAAGTCSPVSGAPHGGRAACSGSGPCAASCDGTNRTACVFPGSEAECQAATCQNGRATPAGTCDGVGACAVPASVACAPYICGETACLDACTDNSHCASGFECRAGACQEKTGSAGGCGCGAPSGTSNGGALLVALGCLALVIRKRRRR